jgi:hypothetical protein
MTLETERHILTVTSCALRILRTKRDFCKYFRALSLIRRVHSLVPRDFETRCRLSPLACLLFASFIFSCVYIIFALFFFYNFQFPYPINFLKRKQLRNTE